MGSTRTRLGEALAGSPARNVVEEQTEGRSPPRNEGPPRGEHLFTQEDLPPVLSVPNLELLRTTPARHNQRVVVDKPRSVWSFAVSGGSESCGPYDTAIAGTRIVPSNGWGHWQRTSRTAYLWMYVPLVGPSSIEVDGVQIDHLYRIMEKVPQKSRLVLTHGLRWDDAGGTPRNDLVEARTSAGIYDDDALGWMSHEAWAALRRPHATDGEALVALGLVGLILVFDQDWPRGRVLVTGCKMLRASARLAEMICWIEGVVDRPYEVSDVLVRHQDADTHPERIRKFLEVFEASAWAPARATPCDYNHAHAVALGRLAPTPYPDATDLARAVFGEMNTGGGHSYSQAQALWKAISRVHLRRDWSRGPRRMPSAGKPAEMKSMGRIAMLDRVYVLELDQNGGDHLVEYADQAGRPFLFARVDGDGLANRCLMFRVDRLALEAYCAGGISRRALWARVQGQFDVMDVDHKNRVVGLATVPLQALLPQYVPEDEVVFNRALSPDGWEAFRAEAIEEGRRRREANIVRARFGPLGHALLQALHAAPEGLTLGNAEKTLGGAPEAWSTQDVSHAMRELHDRNLVHLPPNSSSGSTWWNQVVFLDPDVPWHWGKHPDAIAKELHRLADEGA